MSTIVTGGNKEKSGSDKSGSDKSGSDKSGSDKIKGDEEHELVKITAQVTKDVTRPASNKFETILMNFDKINTIRNERKLTESEQRIYDKVHRYVAREFSAMFKRADPMIKELRKRASVQRGGQEGKAKAAAAEAPGTSGDKDPDHVEVKPVSDVKADVKDAGAPKVRSAVIETQTQDAETQANETTSVGTQTKKGTPWAENFRFLIWIWDGIKAIFNKIISFFTVSVDDKMRELMVYFSVDHLMGMLGNDLTRVKSFGAELESQIKNLQRTVVTGISGAATASIDMILNAFSMMPVIGTTILVWRMFQNMLVIIGATLSVQAGKQAASGAVSGVSGTSLGEAKAANEEIRALKPSTNGTGGEAEVKLANQTVADADTSAAGSAPPAAATPPASQVGVATPPLATSSALNPRDQTRGNAKVGGGKRAPLMHQMQPSKTLKKSAKNFKRSLKRFVHMRPALLITRGGGGLSSAKRELTKGSKYAAASGLFSGYAAL
jgi:hypothetical protein